MNRFTGIQYLQMDIASAFGQGLDKASWADRLEWFKNNENQLDNLVQRSAEPARFLAGTMAYHDAKAGKPIGFMCQLDATASGLQLLSLLSGCSLSAQTCNLVDSGAQQDAYTLAYEVVCNKLKAIGIQAQNIKRKPLKEAMMTHLYGSTAVPKRVFGEDTPELNMFYETLDEIIPGANALNQELLGLWQPDVLEHCWTLPDGFEVVVKVMDTEEEEINFHDEALVLTRKVNRPMPEGLSLGANIIHSIDGMVVREMTRRCNHEEIWVDTLKGWLAADLSGECSTGREIDVDLLWALSLVDNTGFMPMSIIEFIDEDNFRWLTSRHRGMLKDLLDSLPNRAFPILAIHDCFRFHPNNGDQVREQYRNILAQLAEANVISGIASEITGKQVHLTKLDPSLPGYIRKSDYALA